MDTQYPKLGIWDVLDINLTYHTGHFADSIDSYKLGLHAFQFTPLIPQHQALARDGTALLVQPDNMGDIRNILCIFTCF